LSEIRLVLKSEAMGPLYDRHVVSAVEQTRFARPLNRSVSGSMNNLIQHAKFWLTEYDAPLFEVAFRLNGIPMASVHVGDSDS
jgi:hypothetical protein